MGISEELRNFVPFTIRHGVVITSRRVRGGEGGTHVGQNLNSYVIIACKKELKGRYFTGNLGISGRIILKRILPQNRRGSGV